jgi:hypothetical protein
MEMKKQENAKDMYLCDRKRKGAEKCYPQQWQREISIFNPQFAYLSRFDTQFVCPSKYNPGHANSFNTRDFSLFHTFFIFNISF